MVRKDTKLPVGSIILILFGILIWVLPNLLEQLIAGALIILGVFGLLRPRTRYKWL